MDDFETAYDNALDTPAFSNGTSGYDWMAAWCDCCAHDAPYQRDETKTGCPLVLVAMWRRTPREWIPGDPADLEDQYTCVYFRDENDDDPDAKPEPLPDPPGMEALFPRELVEPGRVFIPLPEVSVRVGDAS